MNEESETFGAAAPSPAPEKRLQVLSCMECESPVLSTAGECPTCGTPVSGKEFPYSTRQAAGPDIRGLFKWWGIWSLGVWALSGFSFGIMSSTALSVVSAIYLLRIMRAYYR
ncbi:MAG: hypothetical protein O7F73_20775 [Gammaproteobacteria bacterium]|nr:hypothetical protein [Gammaproteobacteria bacterium]